MLMVILHISLSVIKLKLDQNKKKIDRIHILSRTKGKNKELIYSVFLAKRTDELSSKQMCAKNYLSLPICLCRKQFSIFPHPEHIAEEGSQPSNFFYWLPPPHLPFSNFVLSQPISSFFACLHDWSYDRLICFNQVYYDFLEVRVFQIALTLFRMALFGGAQGLGMEGGQKSPPPLNLSQIL